MFSNKNVDRQNVEQQNVEQQNVEQQNVEQQNVEQQNVEQQNANLPYFWVNKIYIHLFQTRYHVSSLSFSKSYHPT
jgi:hypothetical protein